jgi:uncharacterized membrane protein
MQGLISPAQAQTIAARYPLSAGGPSWGIVIFSSLGALIVGLGVILLLAYNWAAIPKFGKLSLIIGSLTAVHAVGLGLFLRSSRWRALGETVCLLGTMLFGAGIWLVAQVYHIAEHYPTAFLIWGCGATAMALVMPSLPQAMLAAVLLTVWCGAERLEFEAAMTGGALMIFLLLGPLAYIRRSRLLSAVLIPAFLLSFAFAMPPLGHYAWLVLATLLNLSGLLIAASFLVRRYGDFPRVGPLLALYGGAVFLVTLYLITFPELAREWLNWERNELTAWALIYWLAPLAVNLAAWIQVVRLRRSAAWPVHPEDPGCEVYLIPLASLLALCDACFYLREHGGWIIAAPFVTVHGGRSRITDVHRSTLRHHDHGCVDLDEVRRLSVSDEGWRLRRRLSVR